MMELVKRHMFLVGLVAAVVVIGLAVGLVTYFVYTRPNAQTEQTIRAAKSRAAKLLPPNSVFTPALVESMAGQVDLRKKEYEGILDFVRKLGGARVPAVPGLFPTATDTNLRHTFKSAFDDALDKFMKRLNATMPPEVMKGTEAEKSRPEAPPEGILMYAHKKLSFFRPDWVEKAEAPSPQEVHNGQENLWLQEDLVGLLAKMNDDLVAGQPKTVANAPIKELIEIRIGGEWAVLTNSKMTATTGRYMPTAPLARGKTGEALAGAIRAPTLTGRWSVPDERDAKTGALVRPGMYKVLPFRITVVVESRYSGELVRRLKGTESFITVDAFREKPITEASVERARDIMAPSRSIYGPRGIVRLEIVAESLIFQLEGGRITTSPAPKAPAAATEGTKKG
jgi:hypothetical protein